MLNDWTPIHKAGEKGAPINWSSREGIIHRLQDGLLIARARLVVTIHRPKVYSDTQNIADPLAAAIAGSSFTWGEPKEDHETDVILEPSLWASDKLGMAELGLWSSGEERLTDRYSLSHGYDGDRSTFYGIELRNNLDNSGKRADFEEAVNWCVDWLARRQSQGLPVGQNHAWRDFHAEPRHIGLDRDNVFRSAFRAAKSGRS